MVEHVWAKLLEFMEAVTRGPVGLDMLLATMLLMLQLQGFQPRHCTRSACSLCFVAAAIGAHSMPFQVQHIGCKLQYSYCVPLVQSVQSQHAKPDQSIPW